MSTSAEYVRLDSNAHLLAMDSEFLPDIRIDYGDAPVESRGGTSVKLLGGACLYCFAASFASALKARGVEIKSLTGEILLEKEKDEVFRTKVSEMTLTINVDIDDKDEATFEKCRKIMLQQGCLLTYTLEEAIEIEYDINRI